MVTILCVASDAGSGLASTTCVDITGPASSFGVGSHTYSATAVDRAGNSATATTTFTVTPVAPPPTAASVCKLVRLDVAGSAKYRAKGREHRDDAGDIAQGLCEKLESLAEQRNPARKAALLRAVDLQIAALVRAGWLTAVQADTIAGLARRL